MVEWVEEHKRLISRYLTSKKYDKRLGLLKAIFDEYAKALRLVYEAKKRHREIGEDEDFSRRITQVFIKIIDFIYVKNFENREFTAIINKYPHTIAGALFYIIANSKTALAGSPRLYVTTYDMYSTTISQATVTSMYKKICPLLGIKFERWAGHGRKIIFYIPPKFIGS